MRPPAPATKIVTNALDNLDRVKTLFGDKSRTFRGFLSKLKVQILFILINFQFQTTFISLQDFKSQTIDSPEFIFGVCMLFKGHPEMILGINFALPPGYKMEVGAVGNPSDGDSVVDDGHGIIVHTPAGRHRVGDPGLVPVTSPRGRGRGMSRVSAENTSTPSISSTHASRRETQPKGRTRAGLPPKILPLQRNQDNLLWRRERMSISITSETWVSHSGSGTQPWEMATAGSMLVVTR